MPLLCSTEREAHNILTNAAATCIEENRGSEVVLLVIQAVSETVDDLASHKHEEQVR